jgi:hypothetical protein
MALGRDKREKGEPARSLDGLIILMRLADQCLQRFHCCNVGRLFFQLDLFVNSGINLCGLRQYLVQHKYVGATKVAINGGSNGGQEIC